MQTIELTVNQKHRLLKVLEKSKEYRKEDFEEQKITKEHLEYDLKMINDLIDAVNGKISSDYLLNCKEYKYKTSKKKYEKDQYKLPSSKIVIPF